MNDVNSFQNPSAIKSMDSNGNSLNSEIKDITNVLNNNFDDMKTKLVDAITEMSNEIKAIRTDLASLNIPRVQLNNNEVNVETDVNQIDTTSNEIDSQPEIQIPEQPIENPIPETNEINNAIEQPTTQNDTVLSIADMLNNVDNSEVTSTINVPNNIDEALEQTMTLDAPVAAEPTEVPEEQPMNNTETVEQTQTTPEVNQMPTPIQPEIQTLGEQANINPMAQNIDMNVATPVQQEPVQVPIEPIAQINNQPVEAQAESAAQPVQNQEVTQEPVQATVADQPVEAPAVPEMPVAAATPVVEASNKGITSKEKDFSEVKTESGKQRSVSLTETQHNNVIAFANASVMNNEVNVNSNAMSMTLTPSPMQ